ncbi:DUF2894 domain-containing protein [Stenotrophomonas sp.]|uniref:DUF2894 domain-containing protein n=1 Tax=Stenotrophomonas sp. TaxID=69392 RepID=UPI0028AC46D5|nr:DUF2894 domain-containing protein [Stenotrophomonas sp.]
MPDSSAALTQLQAWREQGADRRDPARFQLIAALADRAQAYAGTARLQLDARLQRLTEAYRELVSTPIASASTAPAEPGPLQALLLQLNSEPLQYQLPLAASASASSEAENDAMEAPLMPALDEFQQLWSRIRIDSLLRQCLDALPEDAGPLHSSVLTYRAMALMQDISPEYLQHFIGYVDVLTWMDQLAPASATGAAEGKRKAPRKKRSPKPAA